MKKMLSAVLVLVALGFSAPPPGFVPSGTQWFPVISADYCDPLKLTGTVGAVWMHLLPDGGYFGPFSTLEAGAGGGRLNLGVRAGKHQLLPVWTVGSAVSILRTWGDPLGDLEPDLTALGVNITAGVSVVNLTGGVYRIMNGESSQGDRLWTVGVGLGI